VLPAAKSTDLAPPAAPGEAKEYVIAKGDTLAVIAHKNGVSLKALDGSQSERQPEETPDRPEAADSRWDGAMAATSTTGARFGCDRRCRLGEGSLYVVKSGDTLSKIAKSHGTSFKKIMAMNDLKTTSIRAGQKLKMPAAKASTAEPAAVPASASAAPMATPLKVSAAAPATTSPVAAN
jgi:N-acetylmuramoyl-L-alanine amidase